MTITFKAVVIPGNRHKDGTYPVKIRVTFRGKTRRLPTTLSAGPADLTRSLRIKSADIQAKAGDLIRRMREAVADLTFFDMEAMDVDDVVARIRARMTERTFRLDFFTFADEWIAGKGEGTRPYYRTALSALARFNGSRCLDINDITRKMVQQFIEFIQNEPRMTRHGVTSGKPKKEGTAGSYAIALGAIHDAARMRFNDDERTLIPREPFSGVQLPKHRPQGQRNVGADVLRRMWEAEPETDSMRIALDVFLLSFVTMGANMADIWAARPFTGETWIYHRAKTASRRADLAEVRVDVQPEADRLLRRLADGNAGEWWVEAVHRWTKDGATHAVNFQLARWCEAEGLEPFTFYAARHSWASIGRSLGIEKATIDDGLGHLGDFRMADIYAERSWSVVNAANRKILDCVLGPYKIAADSI